MGRVLIRNIDDRVVQRLKKRADEQGLSLEESLRRALVKLARDSGAKMIVEQHRMREQSPAISKRPFAQAPVRTEVSDDERRGPAAEQMARALFEGRAFG